MSGIPALKRTAIGEQVDQMVTLWTFALTVWLSALLGTGRQVFISCVRLDPGIVDLRVNQQSGIVPGDPSVLACHSQAR